MPEDAGEDAEDDDPDSVDAICSTLDMESGRQELGGLTALAQRVVRACARGGEGERGGWPGFLSLLFFFSCFFLFPFRRRLSRGIDLRAVKRLSRNDANNANCCGEDDASDLDRRVECL